MIRQACLAAAWFAAGVALAAEPRIVGYVQDRGDLRARSESIPFALLTHLNVAFVNPTDDAGTLSVPAGFDVLVAAAHRHGVKVLASLGGGAASGDKTMRARYARLLGDGARADFAAVITDFVERHGLDGLDLDLEGDAIDATYGPFVLELAPRMRRSHRLLTAALSHTFGGDRVPAEALRAFDFVNVMAYDLTGPWRPEEPGPHAPPEFARRCVAAWLDRGLPREKIVLGVPFYGHGFGRDFSPHGIAYREIVRRHPEAVTKDRVGDGIWHDSQPTIRAKAEEVRHEGLGGIMIWSLDHDAAGDAALLPVIDAALRPAAP